MKTRAELVALLRDFREYLRGDTGSETAYELCKRIYAALAEPEAGKTVRVRCAVGIHPEHGNSIIYGNSLWDDSSMQNAVTDSTGRKFAGFITADVPIPQEQAVEVEGEVKT